MARLLFLLAMVGVAFCQSGDLGCADIDDSNFASLEPSQRYCVARSQAVRRQEHFYCRGYVDDNGDVVLNTAAADDPLDDEIWTIFLQYPALAYMDVARKERLFFILAELIRFGATDANIVGCAAVNYTHFCVDNVDLYKVAEYKESVLISLYNLDGNRAGDRLTGSQIESCFQAGLDSEDQIDNGYFVTRFRGRPAFNLTLELSLERMFNESLFPGSIIRNPRDDPTLRPVYLRSWGERISVRAAADRSEGRFASNPDPINYGLEAGDIVFAFFGSVLLAILAGLVVLGFFIHPFFLS